MEITQMNVTGLEAALRGMRNPLESWDKSDSLFCKCMGYNFNDICNKIDSVLKTYPLEQKPAAGKSFDIKREQCGETDIYYMNLIGYNDMQLVRKLIKAGESHRKFLRMIHCSFDMTSPVYFLNELDTYKIATVRNSTSLQHMGAKRHFLLSDFEIDDKIDKDLKEPLQNIITEINKLRHKYNETQDYNYFVQMRKLMPMSYNYKITYDCNYETLYNIYNQRKNHRLKEWRDFCDYIYDNAPYFKEFMEG